MKILEAEIPPRIVLSRKGSDSTYGGKSSLRIGTKLVSIPIPEYKKGQEEKFKGHVKYRDLTEHVTLGRLESLLSSWVTPDSAVHLDPDIRPELRQQPNRCNLLLFGQEGAAQGHLANQSVGKDSLFLFFGWFRDAEERGVWKRKGPDQHIIWGWFQVEDHFQVTDELKANSLSWAKHHPHVSHWRRYGANNHLYSARDRLSFAPGIPGAGVFNWIPGLTLTQTQMCREGATRTQWCMPDFFLRTELSYNRVNDIRCPNAADRIHFKSASIGQEFVFPKNRNMCLNERAEVANWLGELFEGANA